MYAYAATLMQYPGARWLAGGTVAMWLVSAVVGSLRHGTRTLHPVGLFEHLQARIEAWGGLLLLMALAALAGRIGFTLMFLALSFMALREYVTMAYAHAGSPEDHRAVVLMFYLALPLQYLLVGLDSLALYASALPLFAFLVLPVAASVRGAQAPARFMERTARMQWGLMLCVYGLSHVPALLTLHLPAGTGEPAHHPVLLAAWLLLVVQAGDLMRALATQQQAERRASHASATVMALTPGRAGRQTALAASALAGALLYGLTPFAVWQAALVGALIGAMALVGKGAMAALKRDHGLADWGALMPGRGSLLDRLDGTLFAAPLFFHLLRLGWAA